MSLIENSQESMSRIFKKSQESMSLIFTKSQEYMSLIFTKSQESMSLIENSQGSERHIFKCQKYLIKTPHESKNIRAKSHILTDYS